MRIICTRIFVSAAGVRGICCDGKRQGRPLVSLLVGESSGDDDGARFAAFRDVRRKYDPDRSGRERKETAVQHVGPGRCTSFDEDGKNRYRGWLEKRYNGDIETFNRFYKTEANSFETIEPEQYWFELRYPGKNGFSEKELEDRDEKCRVWMDNQRWKSDELVLYFEAMQKKLHALDPQLYLCPDLSQWDIF